jgi:hypothetical protein
MAKDNDLQFGKLHLDEEDEASSDDDIIEESQHEDQDGSDAEHDDARDVMNFPPSYVAASHRPDNLTHILAGTEAPTQVDVDALKQRREELEAQIEMDRAEITEINEDEGDAAGNLNPHLPSSSSGPSLSQLQEQAGAVEIAPGVVVVDPEELEQIMSTNDGLGADSPTVTSTNSPFSGLKKIDKVSDSNDTESNISNIAVAASPPSRGSVIPDSGPPTPSPPHRPASSRRVSFAAEPTVIGSPFTNTVKHFKSLKTDEDTRQKENTPYRPRRNAALPEEIAEYKKNAGSEDEDLDKYRDADLAPLDPVMEADNAGDLILASPSGNKHEKGERKSGKMKEPFPTTPERPFARRACGDDWSPSFESPFAKQYTEWEGNQNRQMNARRSQSWFEGVSDSEAAVQRELDELSDKHLPTLTKEGDLSQDNGLAEDMAKLGITGQESHGEMREEATGITDKQHVMQQPGRLVYNPEEHPAIINAIGMVPGVMFWGSVSLIAYVSSKAYEKAVEQFKSLTIWDRKNVEKVVEVQDADDTMAGDAGNMCASGG